MEVAITGSHGLIGTALSASLEGDGHTVRRLVRSKPGPGEGGWDPASGRLAGSDLQGVDAVVHLAGVGIGDKRWNEAHKRRVLDSRVQGTRLLAETLAGMAPPPPVLLSASGMNYYGDAGERTLTEDDGPGDGFLAEVCVAWEGATRPAEDAGIRVARFRSGMVLAPKGGALGRMVPLFKLGLGGRLGPGRQWWSWISLDDEVGAIRYLLDHDVAGPVNLTAPDPVRNADFTRVLGKVVRRPTFLAVPRFGLRLVLGKEMADELLLGSLRVMPGVLTAAGYQFRHPDLEPALRAVLGR